MRASRPYMIGPSRRGPGVRVAAGPVGTARPRARSVGRVVWSEAQGPPSAGRDLLADVLTALMLVVCFGSIVSLTIKVNDLKEAPSWAILLYIPPILWAAALAATRIHQSLRAALTGGPLLLLALWTAMTVFWSNQPDLTMRQSILYCATFMVACVLAMNLSWERIGRVLVMVWGLQGVASMALAVLRPDWGVMSEIYPGAWSGLWTFKQTLGVVMAVGASVATGWLLMKPQRAPYVLPLIAVMAICVFESEATTAMLTLCVGVAVTVAIWVAQRHPALAVFAVWGTACGMALLVAMFTVLQPVIFAALGKAPTLTGRTDIWLALEGAIAAKPWLGWGFQAFWTDTSLTSPVDLVEEAMDGFRPPDAHSTPLDLHLQLGIPGLLLGAMILVRAWWHVLWLAPRVPGMLVAAPFLAVWTATCFTETMSLYPMDFMTLAMHLVVVKLALTVADDGDAIARRPVLA
jgi:exopolysaccharide production protein ExoQ